MTVWNTSDETYSVVPLYRNEATFLDLAPFKSISACQCDIETMHNLLIFARFQSIFSMTVWSTIDDRYSNVVLYIEMEPHFLIFFASFQSILIMAEWNHIDDRYSNILVLLR